MNGINWNMNCIVKKNNIASAPALSVEICIGIRLQPFKA